MHRHRAGSLTGTPATSLCVKRQAVAREEFPAGKHDRRGKQRTHVPGSLNTSLRKANKVIVGMATLSKQEEYNKNMQREMKWNQVDPYKYHPDRGLYYHEVHPNLLCGSQPRSMSDIDILASDVGATDIINLQQDKDLDYWNVNLNELQHQASHHGITYRRCPAKDFDPHSLRVILPTAVAHINAVISAGGRAYVHCTAGLGRAPAACIAFLFWYCDMELPEATKHLTDIRPCGPKVDAIRGATFDLLDGRHFDEFQHLPPDSYAFLSPQQRQDVQARVTGIV